VEFRGDGQHSPTVHRQTSHVIHKAVLESDFEKVSSRMHEMHRRNINTARKNNVQIVFGNTHEQMMEFYNLHLRTRQSQGVPIQPLGFFKKLKTMVMDQGLGFLLLAYKDGECIAGAVFLHWHKTLTYKYGASSAASLNYRPNNLIMWTAMQWGCQHGFTCFDLGRTDLENTGLRTFKTRWGALEEPLYYYSTTPAKPQKSSTGKLEHIVHFTIQKSPLWVCRLTGELLYRYFG
jgi:lipid II:glycine glycyltransferase (peptidoglycan interpeptide bridge formation enzyme)